MAPPHSTPPLTLRPALVASMSQEDVKSSSAASSSIQPSTPNSGLRVDTDVLIHTGMAPSPNLLGPAPLKRNMACLTCRKRKLRCDAAKPVCGTCAKSRLVAIANNHPAPVPEGECIYGDTKSDDLSPTLPGLTGLTSKKMGKRSRDVSQAQLATTDDFTQTEAILRAKDQHIAQLEHQLRHLQLAVIPASASSASSSVLRDPSPIPPSAPSVTSHPPSTSAVPGLGSSQLASAAEVAGPIPDPLLELVWSGYPKDLPPPDTVLHLSEIFFASSPYRNILYKPNFMASLLLPFHHPNRPHVGLLHAIMAVAVPLSPFFRPKDDNLDPARKIARIHKRIDIVVGMDTSPPAGPSNKRDTGNLSFSEYHLALARQKSEMALLTGSINPMDWCSALLLVSYQLRVDERALEAYLMAACLAKISTPGGLTRMHAYRKDVETLAHSYITPASTALDEHERRTYFWHLYLIETYTSGGVLFFHSTYDDKVISTTFPIRMDSFQQGLDPTPNAQNLHSSDLYTNLEYDDDFLLHLKSGVLAKRTYMLLAKWKLDQTVDVTAMPEFGAIEHDTFTFLRNLPPLDFSVTVQVERLVAVLNVHTIIIHLYQDMKGSHTHRPEVLKRLHQSVALVVQIAHNLNASNFDMGLLHFRTFNGLGIIAKVICHEINDTLSLPSQQYWAHESGAGRNRERLLLDALQALDAILMVLRRSKDRIPYAGRFEALLSKFRSGGWDKESIERSMTVYHIYRAERELETDSKPDPNSGKTGDLWTADDRMSDSWRLRTTKYDSHNRKGTEANSASPSSGSDTAFSRIKGNDPAFSITPLSQGNSVPLMPPNNFDAQSLHAASAPEVADTQPSLEPLYTAEGLNGMQVMDPYGPGPYHYNPVHPESYAPASFSATYGDQRPMDRASEIHPAQHYHPQPFESVERHRSDMEASHYGRPYDHHGAPDVVRGSDALADDRPTLPDSLYSTDQHWPHHTASASSTPIQHEHMSAHMHPQARQTTLQNQADLLSRWNFF